MAVSTEAPNIIRAFKSRGMNGSGGDCGEYWEEKGCIQGLGKTKGKDNMENIGVDGTIKK